MIKFTKVVKYPEYKILMDKLIFLDTETTGNDLLADRLVQISYSHSGKLISEFFKPPLPISVKAQSISHVTNKMIEDKKPFSGSDIRLDLEKLLKENIVVAHNAQFDLAMLAHEGLVSPKFICTLKVARFIDEEGEIPEYNLQFLRYYFELDIEAKAHTANGDVLVLEAVFKKLYGKMLETHKNHDTVINKMIEISSSPFIMRSFNFGKHKGKKVEEVARIDRPYLSWLLEQKTQNQGEEDWIYTLKYYLSQTR